MFRVVPGRVAGKVAFVTGAGRGQGRSHALRLAEEGADVIAVDVCRDLEGLDYRMAAPEDLAETVRQVEDLDRRIVARQVDVRDLDGMRSAIDEGVAAFGRLDVVCANAGVIGVHSWDEVTPQIWQDTLDVNLTGVWHTMVASVPHLIDAGGGSIICTSSTAGTKGLPFLGPYVAAKHGVVGIARTMANELGHQHIRVNVIQPTGVRTKMQDGLTRFAEKFAAQPELEQLYTNTIRVGLLDPADISNAVVYLASDESRYVTGTLFAVDAGNTIR